SDRKPDADRIERQAFYTIARQFFALVPRPQDGASGTFGDSLGDADNFCRSMLQLMGRAGASYMLCVQLERGCHAMAMHVVGPQVLFLDPNFGVYEYYKPEPCIRDLRWLFWGWEEEAPYRTARGRDWQAIRLVRA